MSTELPEVTGEIPAGDFSDLYLSHPSEDRLIFGDSLADGMVVLLEDQMMRKGFTANRSLESGRWARVSSLTVVPLYDYEGGDGYGFNRGVRYVSGHLARFIATYSDGSQMVRQYNTSYAWFVKLNSFPEAQS